MKYLSFSFHKYPLHKRSAFLKRSAFHNNISYHLSFLICLPLYCPSYYIYTHVFLFYSYLYNIISVFRISVLYSLSYCFATLRFARDNTLYCFVYSLRSTYHFVLGCIFSVSTLYTFGSSDVEI